jgi:hypothetical protein
LVELAGKPTPGQLAGECSGVSRAIRASIGDEYVTSKQVSPDNIKHMKTKLPIQSLKSDKQLI